MNNIIGIPQYPWTEGDRLYASALNAAIADGPYLQHGDANVVYFGADPTGATDSTTAFREALASGQNVWAPQGTYLITGQLVISGSSQGLRGDGLNTVLRIDHTFDPSVTTGVIVLQATSGTTPQVSDFMMTFEQPPDLVKTAIAASAPGTNIVAVDSFAGIVVGMSVIDRTARPGAIPSLVYQTDSGPTVVTAITGDVITLNRAITSPGVTIGDSLQFASVRSMFKTLAAGGTATPGGTGIQYPWAIYSNADARIRRVMIQHSWNGVYIRQSGFQIEKLDVYAYNIGLDIDQCYNFPSINDYRFYTWGEPVTGGPQDALTNVYYDGSTIAANLGETDGLGAHNFQTWTGDVNLTSAWTWGSFTNLMLDGDRSNLNISSAFGAGFVQVANCYSTKGAHSIGWPISINTAAGFRATFSTLSLIQASAFAGGILLQNGGVTITDGYLYNSIQGAFQMIDVFGGWLSLSNVLLDANSGRTDTYLNMGGTAALHIENCAFIAAAGTGAVAVNSGVSNPVTFSNISWNGWKVSAAANNQNNGATFVSPLDSTSMQSGSLSFAALQATDHYCAAFGLGALNSMPDGATNNVAFGSLAGYGATGSGNTFLGATAGYNGGNGSHNTCLGAITGYALTTGANNTFIGYNVGSTITTGSGNLHISAGGDAFGYTATESHTFRLGDNFTNLMRATNINTATPQLFLDWLPASASYANDAAAATGGVGVGQLYRSGSAVMCRIA